ncbi:MAG: transglutaminase domain-containing protein [bacterium]
MSVRSFRLLTWGIVAAWIFVFSLLLYRHYVSGVAISPIQKISGDFFRIHDQWFGLYLPHKSEAGNYKEKIGHMHLTTEKIGNEYRFVQHAEMTLDLNGKIEKIRDDLRCLSDAAYRIKSFDYENDVEGSSYKAHGEFKDGLMVMFMEKGGEHRAVNREMKEPPYFPLTVKAALLEQGLVMGRKVQLPVLDFLTLNVVQGEAEVEDMIPVKSGIQVYTAYRINLSYPGTLDRFWMSDAGVMLREELPTGILVMYESEVIAKSTVKKGVLFDYLMLPMVKSNIVISEPSKVKEMKVRLSGIDPAQFPVLNGDYQTLKGDQVEIRRYTEEEVKKDTYDIPYAGKDLKPYLEPTPWVQSDDPKIKNFSKAVRGGLTDAAMVAGIFTGRMYGWIQAQPSTQVPTALDAQKFRVGECLEHTVLYTAAARAAGLPTRMVAGLVPVRGVFYFHTWVEVWIGRWVAVDPARGEWPASAARIRFVTGDMETLLAFIHQIGQIRIEVLEVS